MMLGIASPRACKTQLWLLASYSMSIRWSGIKYQEFPLSLSLTDPPLKESQCCYMPAGLPFNTKAQLCAKEASSVLNEFSTFWAPFLHGIPLEA